MKTEKSNLLYFSTLTAAFALLSIGCTEDAQNGNTSSKLGSIVFQKMNDKIGADVTESQRNALTLILTTGNSLQMIDEYGNAHEYSSHYDHPLRHPQRVTDLMGQIIRDARSTRKVTAKNETHEIDQSFACSPTLGKPDGLLQISGQSTIVYEKKMADNDSKPEQANYEQTLSGKISRKNCGRIDNSTIDAMITRPVWPTEYDQAVNDKAQENYQQAVKAYEAERADLLPKLVQAVDGEFSFSGTLKAAAKADPKVRVVVPDGNLTIEEQSTQGTASLEFNAISTVFLEGQATANGFDRNTKTFSPHKIELKSFALQATMNSEQLKRSIYVGRNGMLSKEESRAEIQDFLREILSCSGEAVIDGKTYPCTQIVNTVIKADVDRQ
jgi:hypothetical protein